MIRGVLDSNRVCRWQLSCLLLCTYKNQDVTVYLHALNTCPRTPCFMICCLEAVLYIAQAVHWSFSPSLAGILYRMCIVAVHVISLK